MIGKQNFEKMQLMNTELFNLQVACNFEENSCISTSSYQNCDGVLHTPQLTDRWKATAVPTGGCQPGESTGAKPGLARRTDAADPTHRSWQHATGQVQKGRCHT